MLAEHLVYNAALAIFAGMLFFRFCGRDSSWIIIVITYLPDLDKIAGRVLRYLGFTVLFEGHAIQHGTFHTIAAMLVFGIIIAFLLHAFGIRFFDAFFFTVIGFGAHLFEDALVYPADYSYLWPLSHQKMGLAWLPTGISEETYTANFFHIANAEVLMIGIVLLTGAILLRTWYEGPGWIHWYMPEKVYRKIFTKDKADKTP